MAIPDISLVEKEYDSQETYADISDEFGMSCVQPLVMASQRIDAEDLSQHGPERRDGAVSARMRFFSSHQPTLKSLTVSFAQTQKAILVSAFDSLVKMMENTCLKVSHRGK
jgi:hypothetical protein